MLFIVLLSCQPLIILRASAADCQAANSKTYLYIDTYIFAIERNGNSFLIIIRHLSNRLINSDDHLTTTKKRNTSLLYTEYNVYNSSFIFSDVYENGSLFIRPFRDYSKSIHAGTFICQAKNAAGSILTTPIQLKPRKYDETRKKT